MRALSHSLVIFVAGVTLCGCGAQRVIPDERAWVESVMSEATIVMEAEVINSSTAVYQYVKSEPDQRGQGWHAAAVSPKRMLKGTMPEGIVFINNLASRGNALSWVHPVEGTNGQTCLFFLMKHKELTRECQHDVYDSIYTMTIK